MCWPWLAPVTHPPRIPKVTGWGCAERGDPCEQVRAKPSSGRVVVIESWGDGSSTSRTLAS